MADAQPALQGLRVLLLKSRPVRGLRVSGEAPVFLFESEDELSRTLGAHGAGCYRCPLIRIEPLPWATPPLVERITGFAEFSKAIVVSRHAAILAWHWLDRYWPQLPPVQFFAVGPSSAACLREEGVEVLAPVEAYNSEALLALPELQDVAGERIVIFKGFGGRQLLTEGLAARGARVESAELYRRVELSQGGSQILEVMRGGQALSVVHSGEIMIALGRILGEHRDGEFLHLPIVVPGARVAALAARQGFTQVLVAASAMAKDIEQAVLDWYTPANF